MWVLYLCAIAIALEFDYADNKWNHGFFYNCFSCYLLFLSFCLDIIYSRISLDGMYVCFIGVCTEICDYVCFWFRLVWFVSVQLVPLEEEKKAFSLCFTKNDIKWSHVLYVQDNAFRQLYIHKIYGRQKANGNNISSSSSTSSRLYTAAKQQCQSQNETHTQRIE